MNPSDPQQSFPSKHRACDECRSRKLACSKEPDGCSRCIQERIVCNYSEQKPMGRPRKRKSTGQTKDNNTYFDSVMLDFDPLPEYNGYLPDSYLEANAVYVPNHLTRQPPRPSDQPQLNGLSTINDSEVLFQLGDNALNRPIDFSTDYRDVGEYPVPAGSTAVELPLEAHKHNILNCHHPIDSTPGPPCSCLASMYLSMASLQEFPSDIETALSTVRVATNTALASVRCEKCGAGAEVRSRPPIESFQNTMLLGTILPIIVNGYKKLLLMVDGETDTAKAAGLKKVFRMTAYGGLYWAQGLCSGLPHLEEAIMEPDEWRDAIRRLFRADLYGLGSKSAGLRGIIAEMEQRQRNYHNIPGPVLNNKLHDSAGPIQFPPTHCTIDKNILCLQIVNAAKLAINELVIP